MYVNGLSIGCNYLAVNGPVLRCVTRNLFNWFTKKCMCTVLKLKKMYNRLQRKRQNYLLTQ